MTCSRCGAESGAGSAVCAQCGTPAGPSYGPPAASGSRQNLKIISGIGSIVAALIVLAGSALPYAHLSTGVPGKYISESIFDAGPGASLNNLWFAAEPIVVVLLAIAGGILLLAARQDLLLTIVAAMLTALGAQTFFMFVGYALGLAYGNNRAGLGGGVGMLGGLMLAATGIVGLAAEAAWFRRQAIVTGGHIR